MSDGTKININPKESNGGGVGESNLLRKGDFVPSTPISPSSFMYRGYFPLWRKIVDWGWYQDSVTKSVFLHLLLLANHEERYFKGHKVLPGQCVIGRKKLSLDLGISEQQCRGALNKLKSTNEITIKSTSRFSIATLNNYYKYLPKEYEKIKKTTSQRTNKQPTDNQQATTPNNYIIKELDNIPPLLESVQDYCTDRANGVDAKKWYNHYQAKGWLIGKTKMVDWRAAVRTWEKVNDGATIIDGNREYKKEKDGKRGELLRIKNV